MTLTVALTTGQVNITVLPVIHIAVSQAESVMHVKLYKLFVALLATKKYRTRREFQPFRLPYRTHTFRCYNKGVIYSIIKMRL